MSRRSSSSRSGGGVGGAGSLLPRGGPAVAIGLTTMVAVGAVLYSHTSQVSDRKIMRAGVERDKERMRLKRQYEKEAASAAAVAGTTD
jgi:hypothetical protein